MSGQKTTRERREHGSGTIEPRGDHKWLVRVSYGSVGGRRIREAIIVSGTKADARKALRTLTAKREGGQGPKQVRSKLTVGEWLDHFTATNPRASEATRRRMAQSVRLYTSDRLRATKLRDLSAPFLTEELEKLRARTSPRTGQKLAGRTVGIWFAVVRAALSYAVEQGALPTNPALKLRRPNDEIESPEASWLTEEQVEKFLATAAEHDPERYAFWRLQAESGLRPAEGAALHWTDFPQRPNGQPDFDAKRLTVRGAIVRLESGWVVVPHTKTHSIRAATFSAATGRALKEHYRWQVATKLQHGPRYDDQGLVFANAIGQLYVPSNLSKRFRELADTAGLPSECTLYSLRHSAVTHRLHLGEDPVTVAKMAGHKTANLVLKTYGHAMRLDRQQEITDRVAQSYGEHTVAARHA